MLVIIYSTRYKSNHHYQQHDIYLIIQYGHPFPYDSNSYKRPPDDNPTIVSQWLQSVVALKGSITMY